ncbi:MFS transporter [Pseudonocardia adelaidensis]|uniref:MFS transporter n=1 Tax=Pseudonocardia adelaidensis TaxID=648754 RepID=A0ABP9NPL8_9PSEU
MTPSRDRLRRRALGASLAGSTLEWYDYMIFGQAAALVFPQLFFPHSSPIAGLLSSFATFAVGFVARPIGAVIAGHFGDRIGRRRVLLATLVTMGVATCAIGLLPTYAQIGVWAPILLALCRIAQGLALGGEWGGSVLLAIEQLPGGKRKGLLGSIPQAGDPLGLLLAGGSFTLATTLVHKDAFLAWGWRVPFLLGASILVVGLWLRLRITETPEFVESIKDARPERAPLVSVLRSQPGNFVLSVGCRLGVDVGFYVFTVFSITYVTTSGVMSSGAVLVATMVAAGLALVTTPLFGALADRVGTRRVLVWGLVGLVVSAFAFFPLLDTGSPALASVAMVLSFSIAGMAIWAPYAGLVSTVFPPETRYTGTSFSFQFSGIIGGGIAPFIATALFDRAGSSLPVTLYVALAAVVSIVCVVAVRTHDQLAEQAGRATSLNRQP